MNAIIKSIHYAISLLFSCPQQQPVVDPYAEPLKAMEVCNVCGALLVVGDAQQRVDEHIMGKQHSGYARIRAYVDGKRQVHFYMLSCVQMVVYCHFLKIKISYYLV